MTDEKIVEYGGAVNTFETLLQEGLIMPKDVVLHGGPGAVDPHSPEGVIQPLRDRNVDIKSYVLDKCGYTPWREKYAREEFAGVLFSELEG